MTIRSLRIPRAHTTVLICITEVHRMRLCVPQQCYVYCVSHPHSWSPQLLRRSGHILGGGAHVVGLKRMLQPTKALYKVHLLLTKSCPDDLDNACSHHVSLSTG